MRQTLMGRYKRVLANPTTVDVDDRYTPCRRQAAMEEALEQEQVQHTDSQKRISENSGEFRQRVQHGRRVLVLSRANDRQYLGLVHAILNTAGNVKQLSTVS